MKREQATIKYWKQRAATWIFNKLWRDQESGMQKMIEKNIQSRVNAALMGWLDKRRIKHCRYCPIVDETPLKNHEGYGYCKNHYEFQLQRESEDKGKIKLEVAK